jgi:hypothetical protein
MKNFITLAVGLVSLLSLAELQGKKYRCTNTKNLSIKRLSAKDTNEAIAKCLEITKGAPFAIDAEIDGNLWKQIIRKD